MRIRPHHTLRWSISALAILVATGWADRVAAQPVAPEATWSDQFGAQGGIRGHIEAMVAYGDGAVFAGTIHEADGQPVSNIASFDGARWNSMGEGVDGMVQALVVEGDDLYVGGRFGRADGLRSALVARWDGRAWHPLAGGLDRVITGVSLGDGAEVSALAVFKGALYAAWRDVRTPCGVARWEAEQWYVLQRGRRACISAFVVHDDTLYAGGEFWNDQGEFSGRLARYANEQWTPLPEPVRDHEPSWMHDSWYVTDLLSHEGSLHLAINLVPETRDPPYSEVWARDGQGWRRLGGYFTVHIGSIVAFEGHLYVSGPWYAHYREQEGPPVDAALYSLARWDGSHWQSVVLTGAPGWGGAWKLAASEDVLYAGGSFTSLDDRTMLGAARWDGYVWNPLVPSANRGIDGLPRILEVVGRDVYVGGDFSLAGDQPANRVARWSSDAWEGLGNGLNARLIDLAYAQDGLFAAVSGAWDELTAAGLHWWSGERWEPMVDEVQEGGLTRLESDGGRLFGLGYFSWPDGRSAAVAHWNGQRWIPLAEDIGSWIFDAEAAGDDLYVAGWLRHPATGADVRLLRWRSGVWEEIPDPGFEIRALAVTDTALIAGSFVDGTHGEIRRIVSWNGSDWKRLGPDFSDPFVAIEASAAGLFLVTRPASATVVKPLQVLRWNGSSWSHIADGPVDVQAVAAAEDGLFFAGWFEEVDGVSSMHFAHLQTNADDLATIPVDGARHECSLEAYPMPFSTSATIAYEAPLGSRVRIDVYDLLGRRVDVLRDGTNGTPTGELSWDPHARAAGPYLLRLNTDACSATVLLLKQD